MTSSWMTAERKKVMSVAVILLTLRVEIEEW